MQIIKDRQIVEDNWRYSADGDNLQNGDTSVSLSRWKAEKDQLQKHDGKIGVRLSPSDSPEDLADDLSQIQLIELDFPVFTDGRSFTQAKLLRERYLFKGEIRATGRYMADQVFYLHRVGVNAFKLEHPDQLPVALSALNDFSVQYQASIN